MTDYNAITPPPELVEQWVDEYIKTKPDCAAPELIAARAAKWGADQELEACCEALDSLNDGYWSKQLRAARRPKPPSLKEQALLTLDDANLDAAHYNILRRALEQLND